MNPGRILAAGGRAPARFTRDAAIVVTLAAVAAAVSYESASRISTALYEYTNGSQTTSDIWFDADLPNRLILATSRTAEQYRSTSEHPLLALIYALPVAALRRATGMAPVAALRILTAAASAIWITLLYLLLRIMRCRSGDALIFTILGLVSASAVFWFAVPEVFLFGSVSILVMLCVAAMGNSRDPTVWLFTAASSLTLGVTVTNWMVGLLAVFLRYPWRRASQIAVNALVVVSLLWCLERAFFPQATFFLEGRRFELEPFVMSPRPGRVLEVLAAFVFHSMIMPGVQVITRPPIEQTLSVQSSLPASGGLWGAMAACAWMGLLTIGVVELVRGPKDRSLRALLALSAIGQLMLHVVFGRETFLYSMHFVPLLIPIAALSTFGRRRGVALALAAVLVVTACVNNVSQFRKATTLVRTITPKP